MGRVLAMLVGLSLCCAAIALPARASAFCGFYVSGASDDLYNDATRVVMVRDGTRTVLSMQNHYEGPTRDFAMIVPVPEVLNKENVRVLSDELFEKVDRLAAPRLVEYWERDPCPDKSFSDDGALRGVRGGGGAGGRVYGKKGRVDLGVTVEAEFVEGEYQIQVLSAEKSHGLGTWLEQEKYKIPKGAAKLFEPYIQDGMYFFAAKVDASKVEFDEQGQAQLSPLRFHYDAETFELPVRLGLINAKGHQDLLVHILAKGQRYEVANRKNVTIPTNIVVDEEVKERFAEFYAALFDATLAQHPGAAVTEYAWQATKCDPCPTGAVGGGGLGVSELLSLGLDISSGVELADGAVVLAAGLAVAKIEAEGSVARDDVEKELRLFGRRLSACVLRIRPDHTKNQAGVGPRAVRAKLQISARGRVEEVSLTSSEEFPRRGAKCFERLLGAMRFTPEGADPGASEVQLTLTVDPAAERAAFRLSRGRGNWVLTRLHLRYTADELQDDLVFRRADPITGGRGMPKGVDGDLPSSGASSARFNQFQGRYAILHPWEGEIECETPRRGLWGGPGGRGPAQVRTVQQTTDIARDALKLRDVLPESGVRGLDLEALDAPEADREEEGVLADPDDIEDVDRGGRDYPDRRSTLEATGPPDPEFGLVVLLVTFIIGYIWMRKYFDKDEDASEQAPEGDSQDESEADSTPEASDESDTPDERQEKDESEE